MRRIATLLGAAAFAATLTAATQAQAATPSGYVLYKTYGWPDACSSSGYSGQQSGHWKYYYCDMVSPASWNAPGIYNLYVDYGS